MSKEPKVSAQGVMDLLKLADRDFIDKVIALARTIKVEKPEPHITRITIELINQK
jgi:hypothetical protein